MKPLEKSTVFFIIVAIFLSASPAGASDRQITWKLASLAPKSVGWAKHIRQVIHPGIAEATDGNLRLKWYWGGIMGEDKDYIDKMKSGQLDGAAFSGQGAVMVMPEMAVLELPFMFKNYEEVDYIREKMFPRFDELAKKRGLMIAAWADQDFDQIYSSRLPMAGISDFPKAKFLTWYGPAEQNVLKKLGVQPIPMGVLEISPAIRQNMADTLIAPAIWILGSQLYTTIKFVNPVKIRYSPVALVVKLESWNSLPKAYQKSLMALRDKKLKVFTLKSRGDSVKSLEAMVERGGVKKSIMPADELKKMEELLRPVWYEMAGKDFPRDLLDTLLGHLADFRSGRAQ